MKHLSADRIARCEARLSQAAFTILEKKGLQVERLQHALEQRFPYAEVLLTTSLLVEGLVTETSNIDLLAVDEQTGNGTVAQMCVDDHNLEIALVTHHALSRAFASLECVVSSQLRDTVIAMRDWDVAQPVNKRYLERAVNGVAFDGSLPYSKMLGALSRAFAAQAYGRMIDSIAAMELSWAAGEVGAPSVYALTSIDYAMEVVLCLAGCVDQNRKLIGSRWRMYSDEALDCFDCLDVCRELADYRINLTQDLEGSLPERFLALLHHISAELSCVLGVAPEIGLRRGVSVRWKKLNRNTSVAVCEGRTEEIRTAGELPDWIALSEARGKGAGHYLSAMRAGLMTAEAS